MFNEIVILFYEDIVWVCCIDRFVVKSILVYGFLEYDFECVVDRFICIIIIFCNMFWCDDNYLVFVDEVVIKLLCVVIRYMGICEMLFWSNINILDIMKDLVILFSNIVGVIEILG